MHEGCRKRVKYTTEMLCGWHYAQTRTTQCVQDDCNRPIVAHGLCSAHYYRQYRVPRYEIECVGCGTTTLVKRKTARYCTPECRSRAALKKARIKTSADAAVRRAELAKHRADHSQLMPYIGPPYQPTPAHQHGTARWTSGLCRVCGEWFTSQHLDVTCSTECRQKHQKSVKRINKDRRRARKRNAYRSNVYRDKVFNADGFRCYICKRRCDPSKQVPHPKAPTIDHVIPLAAGGSHDPLNCRTACFRCNSRKCAGGGGEQLLLVAI